MYHVFKVFVFENVYCKMIWKFYVNNFKFRIMGLYGVCSTSGNISIWPGSQIKSCLCITLTLNCIPNNFTIGDICFA